MKSLLMKIALGLTFGAMAACSPSTRTIESPTARYVQVVIPSPDGISGADFTEVARLEFALDERGQIIGIPNAEGELVPRVVGIHYQGTFNTPGTLTLAGIIVPGLIQIGGQWALQERCIDVGCGGSSAPPISITNVNDNTATGTGTATASGLIPGCSNCGRR